MASSIRTGWHSRGYLPHFDSEHKIQHITFHLADSLPKSAIESIDHDIKFIGEESKKAERQKRLHEFIDAGYGSCVLKIDTCAEIMQDVLFHFHGTRYTIYAWVIMPNHIHVLVRTISDWSMNTIITSWKRFSARKINETLQEKLNPLWQREYWDRYIRNEEIF